MKFHNYHQSNYGTVVEYEEVYTLSKQFTNSFQKKTVHSNKCFTITNYLCKMCFNMDNIKVSLGNCINKRQKVEITTVPVSNQGYTY